MMADRTSLRCAGCGWVAPPVGQAPYPFRCPRAIDGDDIDHVVRRHLSGAAPRRLPVADPNPFVSYRMLFHSNAVARAGGITDDEYVALVRGLTKSIASVDGRGFLVTPFRRCERLSAHVGCRGGGVWVKDETLNVAGSHKARHLMGIMTYLTVIDRLGVAPPAPPRDRPQAPRSSLPATGHRPPITGGCRLAIASCGNAALAAAVVARAAGWPLDVFVPPSANPSVLGRLRELSARVCTCHRQPGVAGDPCYLSFHRALSAGSLPFCVQGSDNGLTIEGGETLAWELIDGLGGTCLDRLIVQVGGGALASACVQAFTDAASLGWINSVPRIFTVQTSGAYPLKRAYDRLVGRILGRLSEEGIVTGPAPRDVRTIAMLIREHFGLRAVRDELIHARQHRAAYMWPWEVEPRSIAHGILDDETYDWAAVVEGMLQTGGYPLVVEEHTLADANALACDLTGVNVDHTGSAGLAGLMDLLAGQDRPAPDEHVALIFSGLLR